jgi:succinate dehydrogenase / fumarate reductase membrane anchor subunit
MGSRSSAPTAERSGFEVYAWCFMRVSGVVLLGLAVFHLLWMHLVIGVDNITFDVVARRWANPAWRLFDLVLLAFALTHGTSGLRTIIDDYVPRGGLNVAAKWAITVLLVVCFLMGAQVIFTFQVPEGLAG